MLSKQLALAPLLGALIVLTLTGTMFVSNVRYARLDAHPGCDTNRSGENNCDAERAECFHVGPRKHECVCHSGYETNNGGLNCTNIEECASSPCMNGSTCTDGACTLAACKAQWACVCASGWARLSPHPRFAV